MTGNFGSNIREIRRRKKLTQEQVAELAGINPKYLGEIERGLKNPSAHILQKLADALNVRLCDIIPIKACSRKTGKVWMNVARILEDKEEHDQQKAVKILEVFFE